MTTYELMLALAELPADTPVKLSYSYWNESNSDSSGYDMDSIEDALVVGKAMDNGKLIAVVSCMGRDFIPIHHKGYSQQAQLYPHK
jgi:hypothetical protein